MRLRTLLFAAAVTAAVWTLDTAVFAQPKNFIPEKTKPETIDQIRKTFRQPGKDYSTGPLWTWNDRLTEEQIRSTMQDMSKQHVKQVWVHPRPGLMTPYLSDEWFKLWNIALDEAGKLDMNVWIYDENSYPSGFAGGFVPDAMPDSRAKYLSFKREKSIAGVDGNLPGVFKITKDGSGKEQFEKITAAVKSEGSAPAGEYLVVRLAPGGGGSWFGGFWYVDLLKKGVTEKFLDVTLEPYRKQFGKQFGKRIPGSFTDEPHLHQFQWNEDVPVEFEKKFGYSLADSLPSLVSETGDWKKVRHDYNQLLLDLFIERWAKPYHDYCEKHGLEFTGHYWEHGWPGTSHGPDNMAMYAWHQRPAIDILSNQYSESVGAQFGNVRSVKELSSAANQTGKNRTLSETYGAGGWDLRLEDMKRIADWQYALGINTTNEHLSYVTIRGARKRDHPQSFSYHAPWWEAYHVLEDYHTRVAYALTRGEQINHVLVIEPTTAAWMYQGHPHLRKIGDDFQRFVHQLEQHQYEYDLGSEDIIARQGKTENALLVVGKRRYQTVILPENMENINGKVLELLKQFIKNGGNFAAVSLPERVDGKLQPDIKEQLGGKTLSVEEALRHAKSDMRTLSIAYGGFAYDGFSKMTHHMRRTLPEGDLIFLCNTDIKEKTSGKIFIQDRVSAEQWHPESGVITPYPFEQDDDPHRQAPATTVNVELPPCGSILLFFSKEQNRKLAAKPQQGAIPTPAPVIHQPSGQPVVKRLKENVLTLDYVDVKIGGEERKDIYTYQADQWIWKKHGFDKSPWDNGVQFKDTLIRKTFPAGSGFSATYRFTLADKVPSPLHIVIERSDLYTITCNGKPVSAKKGDWYLDKSFGKVDISSAVRLGENEVTITAERMTMFHELEAAYLLGDFSLEPAAKGFVVKPAAALTLTLTLPLNQPAQQVTQQTAQQVTQQAAWDKQGMPFYMDGVSYTETFSLGRTPGKHFSVQLGKWYGSVAKVSVNGKEAGYIYAAPWELDISDVVKSGKNEITVSVIGTPKNLLGPHHNGSLRGTAWPAMFRKAPPHQPSGSAYDIIGYGLFEPFQVMEKNKDIFSF